MTTKNKGIYLALVTAVISGVSIFINKFAVGAITPPLVFTASKNFLVGALILLVLVLSGKLRNFQKLEKKQWFKLILIGIIGGSLPFYLFFTGISMIPAVNAALIHKTLVIWVAILAAPFLKEKLTKWQGVAILMVFSGNLLIGGFEGLQLALGELMILGATVLWAIENILAKKVLKNMDPDLLTSARMGFGSMILIVASLVTQPQALFSITSLNLTQWFWMILTAVFLLGYVSSWYRALKFAPAVTVATVLTGSTIITNILSAIFITHTWKLVYFPQTVLILGGIALYLLVNKAQKDSKVSFVQ